MLLVVHLKDHGVEHGLYAQLLRLLDKAPVVFRAGHLLMKAGQSEARVDTLLENPAQGVVPLQNQDLFRPLLFGRYRRCQSRRAAADDDHVTFHTIHGQSHLSICCQRVFPVTI